VGTTLNSTAAALLGLLHEGPMTGGDLVAAAEQRFGAFWSLTRSQVYRELPALASAGYVKAGKTGPRASQPYSLTAAGRKAFASWLSEPPGPDHPRNPVLLRLGFGHRHNKTQLRRLVEEARAEHEVKLAAHRAAVSKLRKEGDAFAVATAEFGVAYERAFLKLLDNLPTS
jgi:DNA-binding PadR family transcriptional regulator